MIFWGPGEVLVHRGRDYRFVARDLPVDFLGALDAASPMTDDEARGIVHEEAAASDGASEHESDEGAAPALAPAGGAGEEVPKLTVAEVEGL